MDSNREANIKAARDAQNSRRARQRIDKLIPFERDIIWYRTPAGRFVRVVASHLSADKAPRPESFEYCEVVGFGVTMEGQVSRVFYHLIDDGPIPDGFGNFTPDDRLGEPVDPLSLAARRPMSPPVLTECTAEAILEEKVHRAPHVKRWKFYRDTRELQAARAEAEKIQAEQEAAARIIVPPPPKPKRFWFFGK